jgi:hypothetical protein
MLTFLALLAAAQAEPAAFEPDDRSFADAAACQAHLVTLAEAARASGDEIVEGPYGIAPGDVRIHMIRADGDGHRITEHRCLDAALASRSWRHSMAGAEQEFTIESVARDAEWLKQDAPEQE